MCNTNVILVAESHLVFITAKEKYIFVSLVHKRCKRNYGKQNIFFLSVRNNHRKLCTIVSSSNIHVINEYGGVLITIITHEYVGEILTRGRRLETVLK